MERFLNHLLYGFFLLHRKFYFLSARPEGFSIDNIIGIIICFFMGTTAFILSFIGYERLKALGLYYLWGIIIVSFILSVVSGHACYMKYVGKKYTEYFNEFEKESRISKLKWSAISYASLLLSFIYLALGLMFFFAS